MYDSIVAETKLGINRLIVQMQKEKAMLNSEIDAHNANVELMKRIQAELATGKSVADIEREMPGATELIDRIFAKE